MIQDTDMIGIYPDQLSGYVPLISFKTEAQKQAAEDYIMGQVDVFFDKIYGQDKPQYQPIPYSQLITEKDFRNVDIEYFYLTLFEDLNRTTDKKLDVKIKWGITFDQKCAPIHMVWINEKYDGEYPQFDYYDKIGRPHRRYGTIDINGYPVFYYIYFTIQEILDVIKIKKMPPSLTPLDAKAIESP